MHWEIHPPRPLRFPSGGDFAPLGPRDFPQAGILHPSALGKSLGPQGMYFPIHPSSRQCTDTICIACWVGEKGCNFIMFFIKWWAEANILQCSLRAEGNIGNYWLMIMLHYRQRGFSLSINHRYLFQTSSHIMLSSHIAEVRFSVISSILHQKIEADWMLRKAWQHKLWGWQPIEQMRPIWIQ